MSIIKQHKNAGMAKNKSTWDQAISEAQDKIKGLKFTVRVYRQKRDRGDPWPGEQLAETRQPEG
jgi:hypothetical protein